VAASVRGTAVVFGRSTRSLDVMNGDVDTQRILERKALVNVRALVEKVEAEDLNRSSEAVSLAVKLLPPVLIGLAVLGAVVAVYARRDVERIAVLVEPKTASEYVERAIGKIERDANSKLRSELEGLNGRVGLKVEVQPNGRAKEIQVIQSSWNSFIDSEASRIVKVAEPFGPIPKGFAGPLYIMGVFRFRSTPEGAGSLIIERELTRVAP
jgi:TonB family protein